MNLEVKIEIRSTVKKKANCFADGDTHNFIVFVQGLNGNRIEHFVKEIVFYLPFNSNSKQVRRKPPYFIQGSTRTSFRLPIDIFFHTSMNFIKTSYSYYLFVPDKPLENAVCVKTLTFLNTPQDFKERLLLGGAEEISHQMDSHEVSAHVACKSEQVEIIENQVEVHHQMNSDAVATHVTCESDQIGIIENQAKVHFKDRSVKNAEQILCKIEPADDMSIQEEFHNQLPNTCIQSKDISEQKSNSMNQTTYYFDELLKENRILKEESETLSKKFNNLKSVITTYVEKLPVLQNEFSSVTTELNELNEKAEFNEAKISTLKSDVQLLKAEILQYKNKVDEVTGKMKRQEKPAVLSSFVSESCKASLSVENESSTKIFSTEKGRILKKKSVNKELYENLNEEPVQHYAKGKQSKSLEVLVEARDTDHTILNPEKTKINVEKLLTQKDCLFRQADKNAIEVGFQECMRNEQMTSLPKINKEVSYSKPEEMDFVLSDLNHILPNQDNLPEKLCKKITKKSNEQYVEDELQFFTEKKTKEHNNENHKKRDTMLTFVKKDLHQNALEETANNCKKDEIQAFSSNQKDTELAVLNCSKRDVDTTNIKRVSIEKEELQIPLLKRTDLESVDSNYQERDSHVSNFIHLENPLLNRKRVRFLPIPDDRKKLCRANTHVQQNDLDSIPHITSMDIPESVKCSEGSKQVCLPVKNSLFTIAAGNKDSYPISDHNPVSEYVNASNSLHGNLCYITESNTSQSFSPCIASNKQFGKFTQNRVQNKQFKNSESENNHRYTNPLQSIFKDIDERQISDSDFKSYVHSLFQFLVNPTNSPDISAMIFLVLNHLCLTRRNYLKAFKRDQANCIFLPSSESCIVTTLFEIEKKSKTYSLLQLIENILSAIHEFVMSKKRYNINGVASFCRVFTEICKRKKDLLRPLSLCADILKMRHCYAPYLIASIVGVWKEPFMVPSDHSDETMILIGAVSLGVQKRTKEPDCRGGFYIRDLILEHFGFPSLPGVNIAVNLLKDKIISNCTQNSHEKSWMLTSSLVILAACKHWIWIQKNLVDEFILPNLSKFSSQEPHEKAFGLFCELYVDVYLLHPNIPHEESVVKYFEQASHKGIGFVKEWATISLMKYLISKRRPIPSNFSEWFEKNRGKRSVQMFNEFYQRRKVYSNKKYLTPEDIVVT